MEKTFPVGVLNTSILTADGTFTLQTISLDEAKALVRGPEGVLSAVGHESTAQILTDLLGIEIRVNRIQFAQAVGQEALVFKLHGRAPEGVILGREEVEAIGYSFKLLVRLSA